MRKPSLEREAKFDVPRKFELPDLTDALAGVIAEPPAAKRLDTEYFDTADYRLVRAGASLRYRDGDGWTVKLSHNSDGAVLQRTEYSFDGPADAPPAAAIDLVRAYVRGARLKQVTRMITKRRSVALKAIEGATLATVADDTVSVMDGGRAAHRFREVEVELTDSAPLELVDAVANRLQVAGASAFQSTPKVARAIGLSGAVASDGKILPLDECVPAAAVIKHALNDSVQQLVRNDPLIRADFDGEAVHQARVATRRLRSHLKTFRPLLQKGWTKSLRAALRGLGSKFGAVRDLDVLLERLRVAAEKLPDVERDSITQVSGPFETERTAERNALLSELRSVRYIKLLERLSDAVAKPLTLRRAADPAIDCLPQLFDEQWDEAKRAAARAQSSATDENLHRLRIRAKQCRYAAETVIPIVGKPAKAFARAARNLQDLLGEYRDATTAHRRLHEVAERSAAAFFAGELAMNELREAKRARKKWQDLWEELLSSHKRFSKWR